MSCAQGFPDFSMAFGGCFAGVEEPRLAQRSVGLLAADWGAVASRVIGLAGLISEGWQGVSSETSVLQGVESGQSGWLEVDFMHSGLELSESAQGWREQTGR